MAVYEIQFAIRLLAINASTWIDVVGLAVLPIDCNSVFIFNNTSVNFLLRSDPNNANSQVTIVPGQAFDVAGSGAIGTRFLRDSPFPICSLLSASGNQNAIIESIR